MVNLSMEFLQHNQGEKPAPEKSKYKVIQELIYILLKRRKQLMGKELKKVGSKWLE